MYFLSLHRLSCKSYHPISQIVMNKITPLLLAIAILGAFIPLSGQTDKGFSYQAVARDGSGGLMANTSVNLRFQIREGSKTGPIVYQETHPVSTNGYGLFHAIIGKGNQESGNFATVDWAADDYYLMVELNGTGIDTSLLEAVPYAKVATEMDLTNLQDVMAPSPTSNQVLKWNGSQWVPDEDEVEDADADPANEIQSLSLSGNNLSLSGSNSVSLPTGTTYTAGTGISISGSTITNTAPDQTVTLSGGGATSVSGSYPNFTVSSTDNVDDADADPSNELQTLSLTGNSLALSLNGGSVNLASFASPWSSSGANLYYTSGMVGIGDNSPQATLTVGSGDKFQVHGSDGDLVFADDQGSIRFASVSGSSAPMIQMFPSGTNNATRMMVAHSPSFPSWGIEYNDTTDAFTYMGDGIPVLNVQLAGQQRVGVGTNAPEAKLHVATNSATGYGHIKLTENQFDYSRITFNNSIHPNFWEIAARTDTNLASSQVNFYHSDVGNIVAINARGRVGINDGSPGYPLEVNGNGSSRVIYAYNQAPITTGTTYNYGIRANLTQAINTGFPRLYNLYGSSTDNDAYLSYGVYGYASGASNSNYGVYAYAPATAGYAVYASGNMYCTGSYQTSDARLKSDIVQIESGLNTVMQLHPTTYRFKREEYEFLNLPEQQQYGFLAQDLKQVLPELTQETFHAYDEATSDTEEGQGMWFTAVNYVGLIPILVAGMQEQQGIIEKQEQQILTQEQRIDDLEARLSAIEKLLEEK